jgi:phage-related baseplate assembly protein
MDSQKPISYANLTINGQIFTVTKATIKESLEEIFFAECEGYCESMESPLVQSLNSTLSNDLDGYKFLDKQAALKIKKIALQNTSDPNSINLPSSSGIDESVYNGIISEVGYIGTSNTGGYKSSISQKYFFKFVLSSPLFRLSINSANRIFTDQTIIDVIKEILKFYRTSLIKEVDFSNVKNSYEPREYISQYNESDLNFLQRICFNNGIYFYEDDRKIYFYDTVTISGFELANQDGATSNAPSSFREVNFNPNINNALKQECIKAINKTEILNANNFSYSSQNTMYPTVLDTVNSKQNEKTKYNAHFHLGQYSFTQQESLNIPTELKRRRSILNLNTYIADSNVFGLKLNNGVSLSYDPSALKNDTKFDFKIIALVQNFVDETNLENRLDTNDIVPISGKSFSTSYSNQIIMLPYSTVYVPKFKTKPRSPEVTLGVVIGNNGIDDEKNTIHTDEHGRVKVRINAFSSQETVDNCFNPNGINSTNTEDYSHSAYLRVMTPIASSDSGFFAIPRIGDEVVVSFLEGDIDKPMVSASLYNAYNPQLPNLPSDYHQTTLSSKTIGVNESGRNEFTFSNLKDKEHIYLKAQKDYGELIQHDFTQTILNDKSSKVLGTYTERIQEAHVQTIDLAKNVNVGAEYLTTVGLSKDTVVGLSNTVNVGVDNKIRVGQDSSEYVGNDKNIEIKGNLDTVVYQNENRTVKEDKKDVIEGSYEMSSSKGINKYTQEHIVLQADNYIDIKSKSNLTTNTDSQHTEVADSKFSDIKSNYEVDAGNQILHRVGNAQIEITSNNVIIRAGGIEAIFDQRGITVIGGEVRAE